MDKAAVRPRKKAAYRTRTHLIHGNPDSKRWDYNHHVIPPLTASTTYRLSSAHRGEQGFIEFARLRTTGTALMRIVTRHQYRQCPGIEVNHHVPGAATAILTRSR